MTYIEADVSNVRQWADLDLKLFPDHLRAESEKDCRMALESGKQASFLCLDDDGRPVGFANVSIRTDYVEGSVGPPVGFLEAIYVELEFRRHGVATELLRMSERWAAEKGCREMGSDTELANVNSQAFHIGAGFQEANRLVAFIKKI